MQQISNGAGVNIYSWAGDLLTGEDGSLCKCQDPEFRSPDPGKTLGLVYVVMAQGNKVEGDKEGYLLPSSDL